MATDPSHRSPSAPPPWTSLHHQFQYTLKQREILQDQPRILVAVSGGQDSLCLLKLLVDLQPKWHWQLSVIHCNHQWRADATANAQHIAQLSQSWQLPYYGITATSPPANEASARTWRYQVFTQVAETHHYNIVVTGHTGTDQAETLLYNLIRGSGADGLQSIPWERSLSAGVSLIRPLLNITRTQTAEFCHSQGLPIWEDSTNQELKFARNRIRQELFPYLQTHFNPQVETALIQTAELLRADVEYLEATAQSWLVQVQATDPHRLNRQPLKTLPLAIRRRVIRQWLQSVLPESLNFSHINNLTSLIIAPNRCQTQPLPGGYTAIVEHPWITLWKTGSRKSGAG